MCILLKGHHFWPEYLIEVLPLESTWKVPWNIIYSIISLRNTKNMISQYNISQVINIFLCPSIPTVNVKQVFFSAVFLVPVIGDFHSRILLTKSDRFNVALV